MNKEAEDFVNALNFSEFDAKKELKDTKNFSALIFAKRRSGKSVLVRDLLSKIHKWYESVYIFCETIEMQSDLYQFIPKQNRFSTFDEAMLEEIYNKQEKEIMKLSSIHGEHRKPTFPHIMVIFDDFIGNAKVRTSPIFTRYAILGRHSNIAYIALSQEVGGKGGIPKPIRANSDLIICFMIESEYDRELIVTQFLSIHGKKIGDKIIKKVTYNDEKPYQALIICNFKKTSNMEQICKTYNANLKIPDFYAGKEQKSDRKDKYRKCFTLDNLN